MNLVVFKSKPCVENKVIENNQHDLVYHEDDEKSYRQYPEVNDEFENFHDSKNGSSMIGHVKVSRSKTYDYLSMTLDCSGTEKLRVDVKDCMRRMVKEWQKELKKDVKPWSRILHRVDNNSNPLSEDESKVRHRFIVKNVFLCEWG